MNSYNIEFSVTDNMTIKGLDMDSAVETVKDEIMAEWNVDYNQINIGVIKEIK